MAGLLRSSRCWERMSDQCDCQETAGNGPRALATSWQGALGSSASIKDALALVVRASVSQGKSDFDPTTSAASTRSTGSVIVYTCIHAPLTRLCVHTRCITNKKKFAGSDSLTRHKFGLDIGFLFVFPLLWTLPIGLNPPIFPPTPHARPTSLACDHNLLTA